MRAVVAAVLVLLLPTLPAAAQDWFAAPGVAGTMTADVGGAHVRLPPGSWELVTKARGELRTEGWRSKVFLQLDGGQVGAVLIVGASVGAVFGRAKWLVPAECATNRPGVQYADNRNVDDNAGTFDCLVVGVARLRFPDGDPAAAALAEKTKPYGGMPATVVYSQFSMTSGPGYSALSARIFANPKAPSFAAALAKRAQQAAPRTSAASRAQMADVLVDWARAYRAVLASSWN